MMSKPFPRLLVLGVMLLMMPCVKEQGNSVSAQDIPYRILKMERSQLKGKPEQRAFCVISLPTSVNLEKMKKVVCEVICREKLDAYMRISVMVFYGIEKYVFFPVDPVPSTDQDRHMIGVYDWNPEIWKKGRLLVALDEKGAQVKGGVINPEFNHKTDCDCKLAQ